jgi:hypothetical protein
MTTRIPRLWASSMSSVKSAIEPYCGAIAV